MKNVNYYIRRLKEKYKVNKVRKMVDLSDVTILSQNCIGGVMYHDCDSKFLSPTVNLYMLPSDFIKFVNNYKKYVYELPVVENRKSYPIGELSDKIKIFFMHYESVQEAFEKWENRKKRINDEKIFVICIERDGFNEQNYEEFKKIKYPKVLFTIRKEWKDNPDCIYISKFRKCTQVPDVIPGRYMYYKYKLPKSIKKVFNK